MSQSEQIKILRIQELCLDHTGNQSFQTKQSVELTKDIVQSGFLKNLPGSMLPVYLYILTHVEANFTLSITPEKMAELLPYTPLEIEMALTMLKRHKFIILEESDIGYSIELAIPPGVSSESLSSPSEIMTTVESEGSTVSRNSQLIDYILKQKAFSEEDLVRAISSMMPAQNLNYGFRQEVDYWFKTFDKEVIKELIRRTDEAWQRDPEMNCQAYMRKIASEWIAEQIITFSDLESSDKIYRQVKSLLEEFGIERQKEMTRTHWRTVYSWINSISEEDFALSVNVAKYAIQQAILRKSDGRPSLNYIEDNFIKPFKEKKIKTIEEAQTFLSQRPGISSTDKNTALDKSNEKKNKWQLGIDFTRFREN